MQKPSSHIQWPSRSLRHIRRFGRLQEGEASQTNANVRASLQVMLIAVALMALFNSSELRSYTRDLPGNRLTDEIVLYSDRWHDLMLALGPAHLRPAVRDVFERFRELRW